MDGVTSAFLKLPQLHQPCIWCELRNPHAHTVLMEGGGKHPYETHVFTLLLQGIMMTF